VEDLDSNGRFKGLGHMPVYIKHDELNQYILKITITYFVVKGFWEHA
jgi:hypothetical protein